MSKTTPRTSADRPPNLFPKTSEYLLFLKGAKPVAKVVIGVKFVDGEEQTEQVAVCRTTTKVWLSKKSGNKIDDLPLNGHSRTGIPSLAASKTTCRLVKPAGGQVEASCL
jgi:hypothetical protein